jgi:hypothetical protein
MKSFLAVLVLLSIAIPTSTALSGEAAGGGAKSGTAKKAAKAAAGEKAKKEHVIERVAVVGASLSDGFGSGTKLALALEEVIRRPHRPIVDASSSLFFMRPMETGTELLGKALEGKPTLVVAIDFLFWFGYGAVGPEGKPMGSEEDRLVLLEEGLKLLEKVEAPLILGDFPDMSDAIGGILSAGQVPKAETLAALNRRVGEWSKKRANVILVPLARHIVEIRGDKAVKVGKWEWPAGQSARLLQDDKLHPTAEGLVAVCGMIVEGLNGAKVGAAAKDFDPDRKAVLKRIAASSENKGKVKTPTAKAGAKKAAS